VNRNVARGRSTREHILDVATSLFASAGYGGTSIDAVVRAAEVTKGSLYHHFNGKDALFVAVLDRVTERTETARAEASIGIDTPVGLIRAGCAAWIRQAVDPVVQQIMLIDAPAVLGWQRWREREEATALGAFRRALTQAAANDMLDSRHVDVFAHALLATVNELAFMIARADRPADALTETESALDELLDRMLQPEPR
jgi:AcrR family transcriptional regulator